MNRGLIAACVLALGVAACDDNGDPLLPPEGGGGGEVVTTLAVVNASANMALVEKPAGASVANLDGAFKGFALDNAAQKYAGFALSLTSAAPKALQPIRPKAVQDTGSALLGAVQTGLTEDGTLASFVIGFQTSFRGLGGSTVFTSRVALATTELVAISELRNRIAALVNGTGDAASLPANVTDTAQEYTFTLTVVEINGRNIVTFGLAPKEVFPGLPQDVVDFDDGKTIVEADADLASDTDSFTTSGNPSADILLMIDNSGSMSEEQDNVAAGMANFFDILSASGVDYQIGVARTGPQSGFGPCADLAAITTGARFITPATPNGLQEIKAIAQPGTGGSGNETGLFCAEQAFYVDPDATNVGFDRASAKDIVLFVSDESDQEVRFTSRPDDAPGTYVLRDQAAYNNIFTSHGATTFSIVGPGTAVDPDASCSGDGGNASGGNEYGSVSDVTGGSRTSICATAADWTPTLEAAALTASGGASQYTLQFTPIVSSVRVQVDGVDIARDANHSNGFDIFLAPDKATVIFFGAALPDPGSTVSITYDYVPTAPPAP